MIRDATGINEVMDGTTPKGEALVGVRQQQLIAGNNAIHDITNAAQILYKKVCEDIVRCLQVIPPDSILYKAYTNAVGETNMSVLSSFDNLSMYNFGVVVVSEMNEADKVYLEQNIQTALAQKEIDLEDAIAIRQIKDVEQAERLLVVRRKKRIKQQQEMAAQQAQLQAQSNAQAAQVAAQADMQKEQLKAQIEAQRIQLETQAKAQLIELEYQYKIQIEQLKGQYGVVEQEIESGVKAQADREAENRKDARIEKQAIAQSKLIAQRQGQRAPLEEEININTLNL
jgi:hypothetical protein